MSRLKMESLETFEVITSKTNSSIEGGLTIAWDWPLPDHPYPTDDLPRPSKPVKPSWPPKPVPCQCVTAPCDCAYPLPPWGPVIL